MVVKSKGLFAAVVLLGLVAVAATSLNADNWRLILNKTGWIKGNLVDHSVILMQGNGSSEFFVPESGHIDIYGDPYECTFNHEETWQQITPDGYEGYGLFSAEGINCYLRVDANDTTFKAIGSGSVSILYGEGVIKVGRLDGSVRTKTLNRNKRVKIRYG